jgi:hypothetical protein
MFSDLFTYEGITFTENRVIYTDVVIIDDDIDWEYGDGEIEAVLDVANGILYFGEYDTDTQVYNKSKNFYITL